MARMPTAPRIPLIGRERVLDALWGEVTASAAEGARVAVVRGPAGIGKTRLLEEFGQRARSLGAVVVAGRSSAVGGYPYGALADALAGYVRSSAPAAATIRRAGAPLAGLVPALVAGDGAEAAADPSMLAVVQSAYRLVAQVTERRPMVWILDDVHAADAETCEVLHSLRRHAHECPWTLVLGLRQPGDERGAPGRRLVDTLRRDGESLDVELEPLDQPATAALATAVLGEGLPSPSLVEMLHRRTAGNPYYVEEMVRWFRGTGHLRRSGLQWSLIVDSEDAVPPSIEEALSERISTLPAADRSVLEWICAAGGRADLALLGSVTGLDPASLGASLEELSHSHLVTEDQGRAEYRVRHPLVSECVYRDMALARRRLAHRALAFALSDRGAPAAEVATHFSRCADAGDSDAIAAAMQAASEAESALHLSRAVSWYQLALSLLPASDTTLRPFALDRLSELATQTGHLDVGLAATQELLAHTPDDAVSRRLVVLRRLMALRGGGGHVESTRAVMDEALELAAHGDASVARLLVELAMYACSSLPVSDVVDVVRRAERVAERFGEAARPTVLMLRSIRAHSMAHGGDPLVAAQLALECGTEALAIQDGFAMGCSVFSRGVANTLMGRFTEAADALGVLADATEQAGLHWEVTSTWAMRAEADTNLGRFEEAVADSLRAEDFGRRAADNGMLELAIVMGAQAQVLQGDLVAAAERLEEARRLLDRRQTTFEAYYWGARALLAEAHDDVRGAAECYSRMWHFAALHGCLWLNSVRTGQAHALLRCGEAEAALEVAREIEEFLAQHQIPRARPLASVALGASLIATGSVVEGVEQVDAGLAACGDVEGPLVPAVTRFRAGVAMLAAGEKRRGVELLGAAHAAFAEMGARRLREQARVLLRDAGVAVGPASRGRDGAAAADGNGGAPGDPLSLLSRRERDVATLAVSGSSSRSIGLRLGISERTVENHLANAYAKLQVHSRAELIALLSGGTPLPR